ncbi:MAG TPA: hypothetical protein VGM75_19645 [Pseudonocardiaceae bacterium]
MTSTTHRQENTMRTFTTPNPLTTVLDIPAGRVHLTATDRTDTTVDIQPANPTKNRDVTAAEQTTVTYTDATLHIHTPQPHPGDHLPRRHPRPQPLNRRPGSSEWTAPACAFRCWEFEAVPQPIPGVCPRQISGWVGYVVPIQRRRMWTIGEQQ